MLRPTGSTQKKLIRNIQRGANPAERMKMKVPHLVPLSRQAIDLLNTARSMVSGNRYVFPAVRESSHPIHAGALNAALRALGYGQAAITAHGFRTTACSLLNELGWRADAIERQLAHSTRWELRRLYNHAELASSLPRYDTACG